MTMNEKKGLQETELYEERFRYKERRSTVRFIAMLAIVFWTVSCFIIGWRMTFGGVQVSGPSMMNTLKNEDFLIVKYYEEGDELPYGSIIVLDISHYEEVRDYNAQHPLQSQTKFIIKRLIAKEGDVVRCTDGVVQVRYHGQRDFTVLDEPYARYDSTADKLAYDFSEDYVVGEGEIFFLGDYRSVSWDSRYKEGRSHLKDRLYKESDIYGIVPEWALTHKEKLEKIFFWREKLGRASM